MLLIVNNLFLFLFLEDFLLLNETLLLVLWLLSLIWSPAYVSYFFKIFSFYPFILFISELSFKFSKLDFELISFVHYFFTMSLQKLLLILIFITGVIINIIVVVVVVVPYYFCSFWNVRYLLKFRNGLLKESTAKNFITFKFCIFHILVNIWHFSYKNLVRLFLKVGCSPSKQRCLYDTRTYFILSIGICFHIYLFIISFFILVYLIIVLHCFKRVNLLWLTRWYCCHKVL